PARAGSRRWPPGRWSCPRNPRRLTASRASGMVAALREHAAEGPATEATEEAAPIVALARGAPLTPAGVLGLQRQAGNRVTMALLQRETATAGATLRSGSKGNEVLRLQMHLNLLDEVKQELEVDSIYG